MFQLRRNPFSLLALAAMLFCAAAGQGRAETADAKLEARQALMREMATGTLSVLQDQRKSYAAREETLKRGFSNMVDIDWIARFVLGSSWRTAGPEQRERYVGLYRDYLLKTYVAAFAQNRERKISDMKLLGVAAPEADRFTARTELLLSTGERLKVDYLVSDGGDSNQIIDIVIENVSLLATHRAEFSQIAANRGIDAVIAKLETLVGEGQSMAALGVR